MFVRNTEYKVDKAASDFKHSECEVHRRKTDDHLLAIRTMLETFISSSTPSIKYVDSQRNFSSTMKESGAWLAAVAGGFAAIGVIFMAILKISGLL